VINCITNARRHHRMPVIDIAWCQESSLLVSCSLSSDAIVWAVDSGSVHAILHDHFSFVNGVACDRIGPMQRHLILFVSHPCVAWDPIGSVHRHPILFVSVHRDASAHMQQSAASSQ
jgi:hypothetical protein